MTLQSKSGSNTEQAMTVLQEDTQPAPLPPSLAASKDDPSLVDGPLPTLDFAGNIEPFGTKPPYESESKLARQVLSGAPTNCTPLEVASYFWGVGDGRYGETLKPYVVAWPKRWNPVIVEFFRTTGTTPEGDSTPWCAALINYCLVRGAIGRTLPTNSSAPTKSARAKSFLDWGQPTTMPRPGDIVVFDNHVSGGGHVAFFLADQGDRVLVLGGNQQYGEPPRQSICKKSYVKMPKDKSEGVLKLLGYRTDPQLQQQ